MAQRIALGLDYTWRNTQDLLHHHIEVWASTRISTYMTLELGEVFQGVMEAIYMIDPETCDHPLLNQPED